MGRGGRNRVDVVLLVVADALALLNYVLRRLTDEVNRGSADLLALALLLTLAALLVHRRGQTGKER